MSARIREKVAPMDDNTLRESPQTEATMCQTTGASRGTDGGFVPDPWELGVKQRGHMSDIAAHVRPQGVRPTTGLL